MHLQSIQLLNFKSYEELNLRFSETVNVITGLNGSGKTNLLDAIHCLCLSKSGVGSKDADLLKENEPFYMVKGVFDTDEITLSQKVGFKKQLVSKEQAYDRVVEHIGRFPCILIQPYDTDYIRQSGEIRRKFIDTLLSQLSQEYLEKLSQYNRIVKQRNAYLKECKQNHQNPELLDTYDIQLEPLNLYILEKRKELIALLSPMLTELYSFFTSSSEGASLSYETKVDENCLKALQSTRDRDLASERTNYGIHKDDFVFEVNEKSLRNFGSQGQQKSFMVALQLAKYKVLSEQKEEGPIVLLDDIFDKLDDERIAKILEVIRTDGFGQIFITDTNIVRCKELLKDIPQNKIFSIDAGKLKEVS